MDQNRKHQVSLRGASVKEISRDALIEKVSHERELRNYARRANAAAIFIQRVWRRYSDTQRAALKIREEWETLLYDDAVLMTRAFISDHVVRPFIFFVSCLSTRHQKIEARDRDCMKKCFDILLESINSNDPNKNYCCLALGTAEERATWIQQAKKLIIICSFILGECDSSRWGQKLFAITSLAMRFVVLLTDIKGWKSVIDHNIQDAGLAVKTLVCFMGSRGSGLYLAIRRYVSTLGVTYFSQDNNLTPTDDKFLITASAVTLALRPVHAAKFDIFDPGPLEIRYAAEQYSLFLLTVPWLIQRLPAVLIAALKHKSILSPCFHNLLISRDRILAQMSEMDQSTMHSSSKRLPSVGWAAANIINLATWGGNDLSLENSEYPSYVHVVITLTENFLAWLENIGRLRKDHDVLSDVETSKPIDETSTSGKSQIMHEYLKMSYTDLLKPVCQQWHLTKLLSVLKSDTCSFEADTIPLQNLGFTWKLELIDIAYFYSFILRIFSALNPMVGSLPVLNMLSFTPGFLVTLWGVLELSLFPRVRQNTDNKNICSGKVSENRTDRVTQKNQKQANKDGANKWVSVLHKFTGKSQAGSDSAEAISHHLPIHNDEDSHDIWDVEPLRCGPRGLSKDMSCLLHLFSATYSHLLLVLDDTEFYEKQVPFTLEQQQRIASALNTLVYNGLSHNGLQQNRHLMDSAIRCLHLIYERDCRHQFCPSGLWLSPGRKNRPPIAVAARYHESYSATSMSDDSTTVPGMSSVITATPHIFPFEERVEMFRELVKMDKTSRKMAGEMTGPGSRSIEVVIRRGHIVEDGFRQLNSLGSRLKSSIHVSFVSECGLPEAGLDYGGLSKEFLTDISKAAFSPEYGLFSQTLNSDRHLMPNASARYVDNGIQMIEFLGRVVGKALYEGILLDYSFAHAFVQKLLGRYSFLDELSTLDPEIYKNLVYVKHYEGDVEDLSLDFTVTEESFGERHVIELKPGGKEISVTNENKLHYIHAVADYKLNRQILPFSNAFSRGLTDLIPPSWLRLFNANEFNQLLSGGTQDIDVDDLRNNTQYTGGYSEGSRTIKLFWEVMRAFEPKERCLLLKFVTSCSRAPLLGFKHLQPAFTIHKVACDVPFWATIGGQDAERLPSASTCYNTLKLPAYKRASTLREKLLYAISSNAGFELS